MEACDSLASVYAIGALAYGMTVLLAIIRSLARTTIDAWLPSTVGEPVRTALPIVAAFAALVIVATSHRSSVLQMIQSWRFAGGPIALAVGRFSGTGFR